MARVCLKQTQLFHVYSRHVCKQLCNTFSLYGARKFQIKNSNKIFQVFWLAVAILNRLPHILKILKKKFASTSGVALGSADPLYSFEGVLEYGSTEQIRLKQKFWHGLPSIEEILQYNIPNDTPFFHQIKHKHTSGQHILNTHIHATMNSSFLSKQD